MLIGQYTSKLTDKDRLAIPKKLREQLGEDLILARWYENCLVLISKAGWETLFARLTGKSALITQPVRDIDRFILGSAFEVSLDNQGRFVLPELLRQFAHIESDVVFVGLVDRVEVWAQSTWEVEEKLAQEKAVTALEEIAKANK